MTLSDNITQKDKPNIFLSVPSVKVQVLMLKLSVDNLDLSRFFVNKWDIVWPLKGHFLS